MRLWIMEKKKNVVNKIEQDQKNKYIANLKKAKKAAKKAEESKEEKSESNDTEAKTETTQAETKAED